VIDTSTAARRQPLIFVITTAGHDQNSVCYEQHDYVTRILEDVIQDDSYFGYIACADEGDDWRLVSTWRKANPNLGITVKLDDLKRKAKKARRMPSAQNAFRRLHLNEWTEQAERWLDMPMWDACATRSPMARLKGLECFGGLDLASTTDLAAFALIFPPQIDSLWHLLLHFFVPRETLRKRSRSDRVPYDVWSRSGHITATDGNVIDYDFIRTHINAQRELYRIKEIAYDRWNASQIVTDLGADGATMVAFGQGFASMSAPTKEFETLLTAKLIAHGGNPVLRWMARNVAVTRDAADNMKPNKVKSKDRIDGIVAAVMAVGRATVHERPGRKLGFEKHGIRTL
jgi:phage terminase large subunit-like protein